MGIPVSLPAFGEQPVTDKPRHSVLADAFQSAAEKILSGRSIDDAEKAGIFSATAYGPLDIYSSNAKTLYTRGVRGLRAQVSAQSVLCEPSCLTGVKLKMKAVNNTIIGGKTASFQAFAAASDAFYSDMGEAFLVIGGDICGEKAYAGAVLMGSISGDMTVNGIINRFAPDPGMIPDMEKEIALELTRLAGHDPYILTGCRREFSHETIEGTDTCAAFFEGLKRVRELMVLESRSIIYIDSDKSGAVSGILITA